MSERRIERNRSRLREGILFPLKSFLPALGRARRDGIARILLVLWIISSPTLVSAAIDENDIHDVDPNNVDFYKFFVADQVTYDDNLYRLPANSSSIDTVLSRNARRQDTTETVSLGLDGQWIYGRQLVTVDLRADQNYFLHNTDLNNFATDDKIDWSWRVGSYLSGQLGADFNRSLANFAETLFLGRDLVDSADYFGSARYQLGPHWAAFGGVKDTTSSHSAEAAQYNDIREKSGNAGLEYATTVDDTFGLEYRYTDARFPEGYVLDSLPFDRDYHEYITQFLIKYALTEKTLLQANFGYLKHDYLHASFGTFSGDTWRVSLQWQPTDKTQLLVAGWRELKAYLYSQSNYFLSKGVSVTPSWTASEKIRMTLAVSWEDDDYSTINAAALGLGARRDGVGAAQARLQYTPTSALTLNLSYRYQKRDSNESAFEFGDRLAEVDATFKF